MTEDDSMVEHIERYESIFDFHHERISKVFDEMKYETTVAGLVIFIRDDICVIKLENRKEVYCCFADPIDFVCGDTIAVSGHARCSYEEVPDYILVGEWVHLYSQDVETEDIHKHRWTIHEDIEKSRLYAKYMPVEYDSWYIERLRMRLKLER